MATITNSSPDNYFSTCTAILWLFDENIEPISQGTAFFYVFGGSTHEHVKNYTVLVTNHHVLTLDGRVGGKIGRYLAFLHHTDSGCRLSVTTLKEHDPKHANLSNYWLAVDGVDLAAVPILPSSTSSRAVTAEERTRLVSDHTFRSVLVREIIAASPAFFGSHNRIGSGHALWDHANHAFLQSLTTVSELLIVGYPAGFIDAVRLAPPVQSCITASHIRDNFRGQEAFLVDKPIFGGSSGSPVFLVRRENGAIVKLYLAGVVTESHRAFVPHDPTAPNVVSVVPMLGLCWKSSLLQQFQPMFENFQNHYKP